MQHGIPYETPDELSSHFDLVRSYTDLTPYLNFITVQGRKATEQLNCIEDVRIGSRNQERIDVFPANQPNSPIVIFVHGGWWHKNTRKDWNYLAFGFLKHGYSVIISDYALCPAVRIPDITQATRAAVVWAHEHAEEINGNKDRIFLIGHSAGGQQAGMMAVTDWDTYGMPQDVLKGIVPMSGIFDMYPIKASYLQTYVQLNGETVLSESPLFQIPDVAPPISVMVGAEESREFHRQSDIFTEAYRKKGHRAERINIEGQDHSTYVFEMGDPESPTCQAAVDFFKSC